MGQVFFFVLTLHILKSSNLYENLFCSNITYNLHNRWLIVFRLRHIILEIASLQPQFVVFAVKQQTAVNPLLCDPSVVFPQKRDNQSDLLNQSGTGPLNCRQDFKEVCHPPSAPPAHVCENTPGGDYAKQLRLVKPFLC